MSSGSIRSSKASPDGAVVDSLDRRLLLLTPSVDLGGGIERVVTAVARVWSGPIERVDLQRDPRAVDNGALRKTGFALRSLRTARAFRPDLILCMHLGLLPIAHLTSRATGADTALMGYGTEIWVPFPAWERALIRKTGRLLTISSFSAHWLSKRSQVDEKQIAVIPLPLEPRLVESASAAALGLPSVADAEAVPATGEGFGLVYAEAGAFGTPAIASSAGGGATDIVTDGVTGLMTAPGDERGLAHAMLSLLEDSTLRERLGGALREHVLARYTDTHFRASLGSALS